MNRWQHGEEGGKLENGFEASIIVPTLNRVQHLANCLTSLAGQTVTPSRFEIIIVDNGSTDATASKTEDFIASHPYHHIRYVAEPIPGLLAGRHRGLKEAKADILCFVDDDIVASPDWLMSVLEAFKDQDVQLVGGPSVGRFEVEPPAWVDQFIDTIPNGRCLGCLSLIDFGSSKVEIAPYFVWGLNFNIRKDALIGLGGFHPDGVPPHLMRFRGDGEGGLSHKLLKAGSKTVYHPGARVEHVISSKRLSLGYFKSRCYLQGISDSYTTIRSAGSASEIQMRALPESPKRPEVYGPGDCTQFRLETEFAHTEGFNFHVCEVRADPALLAWVLRPNYLENYDYYAQRV